MPQMRSLEAFVTTIPRPDPSKHLLKATCEYTIHASAQAVYAAWTKKFDSWFAQTGTVAMVVVAAVTTLCAVAGQRVCRLRGLSTRPRAGE